MAVEQLDIHAEPAVVYRGGERAGEGAPKQQLVVQPDPTHQREIQQVGHDHARSAVRVLTTHTVLAVEQALPQRRSEKVL
jgi:hypothetical protein